MYPAAGLLVIAGAALFAATSASTDQDRPQTAAKALELPSRTYSAIARPSDTRELGFAVRGKIGSLEVNPGDAVTEGTLLMRLDDTVIREGMALARLRAEDTTKIRRATIATEFRREDLRLIRESHREGGASEKEVRDAEFQYEAAKIEIESAQLEQEEGKAALRREEARLAEMRMHSPIDGEIVEIHKRPGETVDELRPVLTIVRTDPLWLDVSVPAIQAMALEVGQTAMVRWQDIEDHPTTTGHVIFKSPVGHGGARVLTIRVEVPNPEGLPGGLHADVAFVDASPEEDSPSTAEADLTSRAGPGGNSE